ncbi:hypothetical protein [Aliarcobacter skirrowii]|uniref:Uncharacterized protein n=1 Tax=Aliarcobacter skirrowii CCUG 10374 TaxID=1032239 RepID=A0AAD0SM43_9BACT|nr:hypothetical protein [Aliarcobacter skirrowii]AXX85311.1 hypothetical protein ASKIR_1520 [Aliarcobacter skirrowii CCUG 10374]KAB0619441.1 hypothetical protein F7P70_09800 [Aliarcobacter skirrowii CCUG 10374]RXI25223.1 hypothetical protein CP959_08975 [Aliarcobacter skirrowii CCUG 10374]SUU96155.1 Uncharacterised protein [Aliarcobacter skirrowii]
MKNKPKMLVAISYFHKKKDKLKLKKSRYKRSSRKVKYYSNNDESLIKIVPIKNCTLKDIEETLLKIFPDKEHTFIDEYGNEYLSGYYNVTPKIKKTLFEKFKIEIDIESFDCFIGEEYESDI